MKILNYDLEEILNDGILDVLVRRLQQIWNSEYHYVTKVRNPFGNELICRHGT